MAFSMFCTKFNRNSIIRLKSPLSAFNRKCSAVQNVQELPAEKAEYPPIYDMAPPAVAERRKIAWHEAVKNLKTIEEKLLKVNMPYYYGLRTTPLVNDEYHYNCLPYIQHWTRTQVENGLPADWCKRSKEEVGGLVNKIRDEFIEAILFQYQGYRREYDDDVHLTDSGKQRRRTNEICWDLNRILLKNLKSTATHLVESEVDIHPRHEAFWMVGGIEPPENKKIWLEKKKTFNEAEKKWQEEEPKLPIDRPFQYAGSPILTVRNRLPLEPVVESVDDESLDVDSVPKSLCDPKSIGYTREYQHVKTIPGFWPGSEFEFGQLSYNNRFKYEVPYNTYDAEDEFKCLTAQGILTSFGWLVGQAYYQGFSTFNDLTYPLTTQTIITDGQKWSFFLYQLNTTVFETVYFDRNRRANKCWASKEMKLFEGIDSNGKLVGFNDDVLRHLIQFYISTPKERAYDMKPYLGKDEETVADIEHEERREFLESRFKHIMSGRPRHRLEPEVYMWEWIYKIKFNTRPMDARRRFFELNQDPWARRLDQHQPRYIPKALRPDGPKSRKKWENTYWP